MRQSAVPVALPRIAGDAEKAGWLRRCCNLLASELAVACALGALGFVEHSERSTAVRGLAGSSAAAAAAVVLASLALLASLGGTTAVDAPPDFCFFDTCVGADMSGSCSASSFITDGREEGGCCAQPSSQQRRR